MGVRDPVRIAGFIALSDLDTGELVEGVEVSLSRPGNGECGPTSDAQRPPVSKSFREGLEFATHRVRVEESTLKSQSDLLKHERIGEVPQAPNLTQLLSSASSSVDDFRELHVEVVMDSL